VKNAAPQSSQAKQDVPSAIQQAAASNQMGRFRKAYPIAPVPKGPLVTGCVLLGLGLFFASSVLFDPRSASFAALTGSIFGGAGAIIFLFYLLARLRNKEIRPQTYYLFERGFILLRKTDVIPVLWDQIQYFGTEITDYRIQYSSNVFFHYRIQRYQAQGWEMQITRAFRDAQELAQIVEKEVINRQLPITIKALEQGKTVPFGSLALNRREVIFTPDGKTLPWNQVEELKIHEGDLHINARGHKFSSWQAVRIAQVPNYKIFMALAKTLQESNQAPA
jgi:hypothetical protein